MKCERCGENEANVEYTQIVNGIKDELNLCNKCANELGIQNINLTMPIDFSDFFGEFLISDNINVSDIDFNKQNICGKCKMTFEEFAHTGKFGCDNCYKVFSDKIDRILKGVHGTDEHVGRKILQQSKNFLNNKDNIEQENNYNIAKIEELKIKLKQLISKENYEQAAIIRDEIRKLEGEK